MPIIQIGCDEVGRGAIAGPIVGVAYVCTGRREERVRDSKLLSSKNRAEIAKIICQEGYGKWVESWVSAKEIDTKGIEWANNLVLKGAVEGLIALELPDVALDTIEVLIDGSKPIYGIPGIKQRSIIQGDRKIYEISAASIIAKTERDRWMSQYTGGTKYGFETNSGYGTKEHQEAIKEYGLSPIHRKTFVPKDLLT